MPHLTGVEVMRIERATNYATNCSKTDEVLAQRMINQVGKYHLYSQDTEGGI